MVPNAPTPPFPVGFNALPAPYGIGFVGAQCSEPTLIALAYAFEQATKVRRPPTFRPNSIAIDGSMLAAIMPFLAGFIGLEAMARYGSESGLSSYRNITQLASDTGPFIGGIALAAVLAALISSGAPILLGTATMFVNDWVPGSDNFSPEKKLKVYKLSAVMFGTIATIIAWQANITSVLQLLLLGYAMVVPPAIAIVFIFYWKRTSEIAAFYGILSGYVLGLGHWGLNTLYNGAEYATAGGFPQYWHELELRLGEWADPTFSATLVPLLVIPVLTILYPDRTQQTVADKFYFDLGNKGA